MLHLTLTLCVGIEWALTGVGSSSLINPQAQSHPITLQAWESVNTHTQPPEPHTHHVQELNDKAN